MTELLPCPFCGSGWLYETRRNGYCDETPTMFCNSCKAVVTWEQVEEEGVNDETKTFVRKHWNTRAERTCFADEVTHRDCKYSVNRGWRERTCEEYGSVRVWQSCNVWSHELSCGHEVDTLEKEPPNYCPSCGAKVVEQ